VASRSRRRNGQSSVVSSSTRTQRDATADTKPSTSRDGAARAQVTKSEHDTPSRDYAALLSVLSFLWEFFNSWKRLIGFAFAIWAIAFAVLLIMAGPALLIYIATLHVPVAAKIGISSGSVAITLGSAVFGAFRVGRRGGRRDR
jgi:hypothetical protein